MGFPWQHISIALHKKLESIFILSSTSWLCRYSSGLSGELELLDLSYLKQKLTNLMQKEKIVALLVNKVYASKIVEYINGAFVRARDVLLLPTLS